VTNILTAAEASNALRCDVNDPEMLDLLPQVDTYIKTATGHDWSADTTISPVAKSAARMLLVMWHENPAMMAQSNSPLLFGLTSALVQLEALASEYMEFEGLMGAGPCILIGANVGDTVLSVVGLVGISGNQASSFESVISVQDQIQQVSTANLDNKWFRANLIPVGHL
jgi:hypothetical protein